MPLKPEDRAQDQRDYRARQAGQMQAVTEHEISVAMGQNVNQAHGIVAEQLTRIHELEAEVKALKQQLATREEQIARQANSSPDPAEAFRTVTADGTKGMARDPLAAGSWMPEFRPAPKSASAPRPKGR
jgi:hypothetical protein